MLRGISNVRCVNSITENLPNYQIVRWANKPRWLPVAKSKQFRIPVRPTYPVEETEEVKRLFNIYRTAMKSVNQFLFNRYNVSLQATADIEQIQKAFELDLEKCNAINAEWNEKIRQEREIRIKEELDKEIAFAENRRLQILTLKEEELALAEELVRKEKAAVVNFVTMENLDEVIEKAISNPVDYNFAIDLDGNKIVGRDTKPTLTKT